MSATPTPTTSRTHDVYDADTDAVCVCVRRLSAEVGLSAVPVGRIARRKGCVLPDTPLLLLYSTLVTLVLVLERIRDVYKPYTFFIKVVYVLPKRVSAVVSA